MKRITKRLSVAGTRLSLLLFMALLPNMASAQCPDDNHPHMIDLGLPSGTKWACCNVGATTPEGYGDYFAWGETQPKIMYNWDTYQFGSSWDNVMNIGTNIAGTEYDAATANWGVPWQMPTLNQCKELYNNCSSEWTMQNGINGRTFTGPNGGTIFLPAAGCLWDDNPYYLGTYGCFYSSSLNTSETYEAYELHFGSGAVGYNYATRGYGRSVRPVAAPSSDILINEATFPDENFRNWVLSQTYGQDGVLTAAEIAGVTSMDFSMWNIANLKGIEYFTALTKLECSNNQLTSLDVSHNTALTYLSCYMNQLTSLDVSHNTALTTLWCGYNQLTSLDVSHNTALTSFECGYNQLTSLDVSHNTALTSLSCGGNQLTSLDVSHNTALTSLGCDGNQLTSLDVSHNTALTSFGCGYNQLTSLDVSHNTALMSLGCSSNQLTSLDVSHNTALTTLHCSNNRINETEMGNLVEGLPTVDGGGSFYVKQLEDDTEHNVITKAQVAAAKMKGWKVYAYDANTWNWVEYEGDEVSELDPIDTVDFGSDIDGDTDLDGNVVGDIYYNISSGDGGYNVGEGCIVVTTPTDDSVIDGQDIFGEDFQAGFTGIVFKVPAGKGTIKVEAETSGTMVLKVKIGDAEPVTMELEGRLKVSFPYNVSEPTYVYIYGGTTAGAPDMAGHAAANGELKLYGIEVTSDETGISPIDHSTLNIEHYYTLDGRMLQGEPTQKGVYIVNGHKVVIK